MFKEKFRKAAFSKVFSTFMNHLFPAHKILGVDTFLFRVFLFVLAREKIDLHRV